MSVVEHERVVEREKLAELDEVGQVLIRAAERVRSGWCQGVLERDNRVCLVGALCKAEGRGLFYLSSDPSYASFSKAFVRVKKSLGVIADAQVEAWNDRSDRTAEEVAEALERAAWGL